MTAAPGTDLKRAYERTRAEVEAKFPGISAPATAWHANEIIKRLDRLIELLERRSF